MSTAFDVTHKGAHHAHWLKIIKQGSPHESAHHQLKILQMNLGLFKNIFEKAEHGIYQLDAKIHLDAPTIARNLEHIVRTRVDGIQWAHVHQKTTLHLGRRFGARLLSQLENRKRPRLLDDPFARILFEHAYIEVQPNSFKWLQNECEHTLLYALIFTFFKAGSGRIQVPNETRRLRTLLTSCIPLGQHAQNPCIWYVACA